ncbi:MAG: hypothetical protein OHM56_06025 [Spiroplasma phoeniceum]|nr:MAG: hypothetical protein OHM57_05430 [Spiroplasma phoeniceum]UZQ33473.1 MAG: hypothetical protein OHM56_06025 [Spiroplasma phoeniceum]
MRTTLGKTISPPSLTFLGQTMPFSLSGPISIPCLLDFLHNPLK